jgi:hypothetical protein
MGRIFERKLAQSVDGIIGLTFSLKISKNADKRIHTSIKILSSESVDIDGYLGVLNMVFIYIYCGDCIIV